MADIDARIFQQFKMFEEIDNSIKKENSSKSTLIGTHVDGIKSRKSLDRISYANEIDYPLQSNHKKTNKDDLSYLNLYSNESSNMGCVDITETPKDMITPYANRNPASRISDSYRTAEHTNKNLHHSRRPSSRNLPKGVTDIGERLTQIGMQVQKKIERKRIEDESKLFKEMTPRISPMAKKIQRDPTKFHERLYPKHLLRKGNRDNSYDDFHQSTGNFIESPKDEKIYRRKNPNKTIQFNYKPTLDKYSLKLAKNLEPSNVRLTRKKSKPKQEINKEQSRTPTPKSRERSAEKFNQLYRNGLDHLKTKEEQHKRRQIEIEEAYKKFPFRPKILTHSPTLSTVKAEERNKGANKTPKRENSYDKQVNWKKKIDTKNNKIRESKSKEILKQCTFKPHIDKQVIENDDKFIMRNIGQIEEYVNKRRNFIQKQKEFEEYRSKRFTHGENYQMKITIPNEFNFHTDQAISRSKERICSKLNRSPSNLARKRDILHTRDFFDENDMPYYGSFCEERKDAFVSIDIDSQSAFMNAVNNLHDRIVNLKI